MRRECNICGIVQDEYWMQPYNAGAKTLWICWDCYKASQREANLSDHYRHSKLLKIKKAKEFNK